MTSPAVGWFLDRFGSRVMLPVAAMITGLSMIELAFISHSWHLVLLFAIMGLVGMSGPGALVTSVPVLKWFVVNRSKAILFMSLGIPVGAMLFVPLTQYLIATVGWDMAWIVLAVLGMGVIVPLAATFVRRQPEDMRLLPDGDMVPDSTEQAFNEPREASVEVSWSMSEAVCTTTLWRLVVVFGRSHWPLARSRCTE